MEESILKHVLLSVSVVLFASLISIVVWSINNGNKLFDSFNNQVISTFSSGSSLIDAYNLDSLDSLNVYKLLEVNRNVIVDWKITNKDGSNVDDWITLKDRPLDRFEVNISGDSAIGYKIDIKEIDRNYFIE